MGNRSWGSHGVYGVRVHYRDRGWGCSIYMNRVGRVIRYKREDKRCASGGREREVQDLRKNKPRRAQGREIAKATMYLNISRVCDAQSTCERIHRLWA